MKKIHILPILLGMTTLLHCWSRQEHDVTRPLIPHYFFSGSVIDIDTAEPLPETRIKLQQVDMLYEVEFGTQIINADSTGYFQFDSVYPGNYTLSMERDGYFINETRLKMEHNDTSMVLQVPKVMGCFSFSSGGYGLGVSGNKAWFLSKSDNSKYWWLPNSFIKKFKQVSNIWKTDGGYRYLLGETKLYGMAFGKDGVYSTVYPDSIYAFSFADGSISNNFAVSNNVLGIAFHISQQCIYTCSSNKLYKHETGRPTQIEQTFELKYGDLRALAYYRTLYVWESSENLLLKLDDNNNIVETFALINETGTAQITNIYDMSFDGYGKLWTIGEYSK